MQRWVDVGFTPAQAELLSELVTRKYLDERLRLEFGLHKRSMLMWMLVMQAPMYAALIAILMKLSL
jgi:hypothetical protein